MTDAVSARNWPDPKDAIAVALVAAVLMMPFAAGGAAPLAGPTLAVALGLAGLLAAIVLPASRRALAPGPTLLPLAGLALAAAGLAQAALAQLPLDPSALVLPDRTLLLRPGSLSPDASRLAALRIGTAALFFWLMLLVARDPRRARRIALGLVAAVAVQALWALMLLGPLVTDTASPYPGAATGGFIGRNALATHLGIGLVLGLSLPHDRTRVPVVLALMTIALALIATQSRMGLAATGVALAVILLAERGRRGKVALGLAALALVALAALVALGTEVAHRAVHLGPDLSMRIELYRQILPMIAARPLTGFGLDSFPLAFEIFHRPPLPSDLVWDRGHSSYLTLWAEAGLVAGSLPPLAGLAAVAMLWRRRAAPLALAGAAALILAGLHSLVDFSLELPANLHLLLAVTALGLGPTITAKG